MRRVAPHRIGPVKEARPLSLRRILLWAAAFAVLVAIGFGPRWWEHRLYRQAEAVTGVGATMHAGTLADARRKIDPGRRANEIEAALGKPSLAFAVQGDVRREMWTYYYPDGTMVVNLTAGIAERISVTFGPPLIPTSRRPR